MSRDEEFAQTEFGRRVAALRAERGLTQRALAEAAGISVTFLSELENGKRNVSADVLLRLSEALGTASDHLLRGSERSAAAPASFPPSLTRAAERNDWSYAETAALLDAHSAVMARRSRQARRELGEEDWEALHQRFFGND
jgi:transcriptional regulator with XRE-family HTH domain